MRNKIMQLGRYGVMLFGMPMFIGCSKLNNQASRQTRKAESTEERESLRSQGKITVQKNKKRQVQWQKMFR